MQKQVYSLFLCLTAYQKDNLSGHYLGQLSFGITLALDVIFLQATGQIVQSLSFQKKKKKAFSVTHQQCPFWYDNDKNLKT